ncbi:MAG: protein TolR [Proteobacteria bacterium ST_bin11]|jgi:biopolymer transport protein TolR|uniref:Tol-Pal system protein TolR n=2 Tax=Methylococcaceae TaxID=403 RepID=A0A177LW95_METMH|nr:protein TolR [Methylomonas methanica]OQW73793.1 MAG: protein TolR [Proteobacteria bacterium ST_bin11]
MNVGGSNRRSRKKRGVMAEINVVPYIDVTFVLLMIFMITAPLVQTGVEVELPQAEADSVDLQDQVPVIVSIKKDGSLYVDIGNGDEEAETPVDVDTVKTRVAAVFRNNPKAQLYVRGDHEVEYGSIVSVMVELKKTGAPKVGLMTAPPPDSK